MSSYHSGFSGSIEAFVNSRKISGAWNETVSGLNIRIFDHYCARHYPGKALRQEMVDIWCAKRETENVNSCYTRTLVTRLFTEYLHKHGQTDILPPPVLKQSKKRRISPFSVLSAVLPVLCNALRFQLQQFPLSAFAFPDKGGLSVRLGLLVGLVVIPI